MRYTAQTYLLIHYSGNRKEEILLAGLDGYVVGRVAKQGSASANDVGIDDQFVSRKQCRIFWHSMGSGGNWIVEDLGSSNGTKLNGFPVLGPTPIPENGEIHVGTTRLMLSPESAGYPAIFLSSRERPRAETPPMDQHTIMMQSADPEATMIRSMGMRQTWSPPPDSDATVMVSRPPPPADADRTVMQPRVRQDQDATILQARPGDPTMARTQTEDATEVRPPAPADHTTFLAPREDGTTLQNPPMEQGTIHLAADDVTVTRARDRDESATVSAVAGRRDGTGPHADEPTRTMPQPSVRTARAENVTATVSQTQAMDTESTIADSRGLTAGLVAGNLVLTQSLSSNLVRELLEHNYLDQRTAVDLLQRAQQTGQTFFSLLIKEGASHYLDQIYQMVADQYHLTLIQDEQLLGNEALSTEWLSFSRALELGLVMLQSKDAQRSRYGTTDPFQLANHDWVVRCSGKPADKVLVHPNCFTPTLNRLREKENQSGEEVGLAIDITPDQEVRIREQISDVDVPQMVNFFLHRAHSQRASDIHIEPTEDMLLVRNRVDGILHEEISLPMAFHSEVVSRLKILSGMDVAEKRRPQDGRFGVLIRDNPIDIRVSSYPTVYGEKFVLRLLDKNALRPSIESLGLLSRDLRLIKDKLKAPYGMIIISGPTGSGKTTTLYSCLASMDKDSHNVLTVEDPVEYRLKGVHQMQVNHKIGLTFASGLRTILRQDPDVIMVGEIRDPETANMAVQASLTGHIVFSTIHANDSVGVITRMLDMKLEPFLVATSVSLALAQRLIRTVCKHCKTYLSGAEILESLHKDGISDERLQSLHILIEEDLDYAQGAGCRFCRGTGYSRRQAVFELFEMTDQARSEIMRKEFNADTLRRLARESGMTTLISHGLKLVEEEITTFQEVIRVLGE